jgi:hypothetical protein
MSRVAVALAAGLAVAAAAIGLTLVHTPMIVALKNGTVVQEESFGAVRGSIALCQAGERLPRGTSALRFWLGALTGPRVTADVVAGGRTVASGEHPSGWTGRAVTVPVRPLRYPLAGVTVCLSFQARDESVTLYGRATPANVAAYAGRQTLPGRVWIEYLRPGTRSWASLLPSIARHMQLGRTTTGAWIVVLVLVSLAAAVVLGSRLLLRELRP